MAVACIDGPSPNLGNRTGHFGETKLSFFAAREEVQNSKLPWLALQVRSRREGIIVAQLRRQGYECFHPTYKSLRKWSDRVKELNQPLFPGYLFCRFDFKSRRNLLVTPGVIQIVGNGKTPIADVEIEAIQLAQTSGLPSQPWPYLEVGERVRVNYGSMSGLEGILVNFKGNHRVLLSITLLQRSVAIEVDLAWVTPLREQQPQQAIKPLMRPVVRVPVFS